MSKISILILCGNITKVGGTERAIMNLVNSLADLKTYKVLIVSAFSMGEKTMTDLQNDNIALFHMKLPVKGYANRIVSYYELVRELEILIDENDVKIITGTTHAFNCLITFVNRKVKKVGWEHMIYEECPAISRLCRRWRYKHLDRLVVLTKTEIPKYSFMGVDKIQVIYNAASFECDCVASLASKRIIYVGRLERIKRIDLLVDASVKIKKAVADWKIDIYGYGSEKQKIVHLIHEKALDDYITIHEPVSDIKREYLDSSIIVLTSRSEGLPMVLIEAQTCGLPIVSFDCPNGPKEIVSDGEDGFLVEQGNVNALAKQVITLAKNKSLREKMGCCAKTNSFKFSKGKIAKEWDSMFGNLLLE